MRTRIFTLLFAFLAIAGNAVWGQETSWTGEGSGTVEDPYQISTADELKAFRDLVNDGDADACAKLMNDIDLNNEEWTPIMSTSSSGMGYTGTFDGNNKTINGLSIKKANDNAPFYGLFGIIGMINMTGETCSTDGIVKNLTIEGEVEIRTNMASAAGTCFRNHGTIENCINKASVTSESTITIAGQFSYSGGICYQNFGTIRGCANLGAVSAQTAAAGISASNAGTIEKCYNGGSITSDVYAGGICIADRTGTSRVKNCYNIGTIKSGDIGSSCGAAGICFLTQNLSPSVATVTISNCHNYGTIEGKHCAGILAIEKYNKGNEDIFSVTNNYYKDTDDLSGYLIYTNSTEETKDQQGVCEPKSAEAFANGEVLYLLQQNNPDVWVQTIGTDDYPKFETEGESATIYKVTFDYNYEGSPEAIVNYMEADETVTFPTVTREGYTFLGWSETEDGEVLDISTPISIDGDKTYYAQWQEPQTEEPGDEDEDQDNEKPGTIVKPIKYYNIYIDTVCPGLNVEVSKDVVQEGHQVSAYLTIQSECDTTGMRFEYKRGLFGYWQDLKALEGVQPGEYIIKNIYTDIYIRALDATLPEEEPTGIEDIEGVKAYAKEGSIYVYTPNREQVTIISMSGAIIKHAEQVGLQSYSVSRGIYIVRIGEKVFKLKN